ncbi:NUCLEOPORIN [Salix purpurea]|uniref:NUCLEOPORIN n=2 Tax=Salix purpurea TaxID=77065 RepID=A0A9Q0ULH5_SALPP|nr:NUCLEOPORIN [Salix purpurea]
MDKNKSRTDLLAAGRKKLQQFRQKKDSKGSSSHGRSKKNSSTSEKHESDADEASSTGKAAGLKQVHEWDVKSQSDSDSGRVDSFVSSGAPDVNVDVVAVDPPIPLTAETRVAETALGHDAGSAVEEGWVDENHIDSSKPYEGESSQSIDDKAARVVPLGSSDIPDSEAKTKHDDAFVSVDVSAPHKSFDTMDDTTITGETESQDGEDGMRPLSSQEDTPDTPSIPARGDQEADGLDSKQFGGSSDLELERDRRLSFSGHGEIAKCETASEQIHVEEAAASQSKQSDGVDDASASVSVTDLSVGLAASTTSEADGTAVVVHEATNEHGKVVDIGPSTVENVDIPSGYGYCGNDEEGIQSDRLVTEASSPQYFPEDSFVFVDESDKRPLLNKLGSTSEGYAMSALGDLGQITFLQLIEVIKGLNEDEYRLLLKSRGSVSNVELGITSSVSSQNGFPGLLERLGEELFLTNCTKDILQLQLSEQSDLQIENDHHLHQLDDEISVLHASLIEARERGKSLAEELAECRSELQASVSGREELEQQFHEAKAEVEEVSAREYELQNSLEMSQSELLRLSKELADSQDFVAALQEEVENLNGNLVSLTQERKIVEEGKKSCVHENEKLLNELTDCKSLIAALQTESSDLRGTVASMTEEKIKLNGEKEYLSDCRDKICTELSDCKALVEALQVENLKLSGSLAMATEERKKLEEDISYSAQERDKLSSELLVLHDELSKDHAECLQFESELKEMTMRLKGHLEEAGKVLQCLEKAIEVAHSHSVSLTRAGGKSASPAVSKLIQAFESKGQQDENETQDDSMTEDQSPATDPFASTKEYTGNLKAVLKHLALDAENASLMFKTERDDRSIANCTIKELKFQAEALKEHSDNLEATNIQLGVLYEAAKQHLSDCNKTNDELEVLCDSLRQQEFNLKAENSEFGRKLSDCELKIEDLQSQLHGLQRSSDEKASALHDELAKSQMEAAEKALTVEQEWNSTAAQITEAVDRLDASTGFSLTSTTSMPSHGSLDVCSHVTASVNAATNMIQDLKEKLEASSRGHETASNLFNEVSEKCNDLLGKNELANATLHKLYSELRNIVIDVEESNLLDEELPATVEYIRFKAVLEKLENALAERLQLQSANKKLNSEWTSQIKDIEELNRRCHDFSSIQRLIEDVEGEMKLEDNGSDSEMTPVSHLESLVSILVRKYKKAKEQVNSSKEEFGSKVLEMTELQKEIHQLTGLTLQHENEILVLKEHLTQAEEALVTMRSEWQEKVSELQQSEQRVSSIREKLSIAVAKGKGLVVQRDSLKQSLAETSGELDRCSQELHLKDARLHEIEAKLKTYSEAGGRVEALESELSYIRNSATALRESFLLKDSVLQRIEEILEDLDLPEHFHSRDIIEKVDWLARSATANTLLPTDWDQKSSVGGSHSDTGFAVTDAWKEDVQSGSNSGDDLRRKYEELQSKFYGLAEQNEMLEQSLMERNNLVQRWEERLARINLPSHLRLAEPEDRIEWLENELSEASHDRNSMLQKTDELENYCRSVTADLEELQDRVSRLTAELLESSKRVSDLERDLQAVILERENLFERLEILTFDAEKLSAKTVQFELDNEKLQNEASALQEKLVDKLGIEEHIQSINDEIRRMQDLVCDALQDPGAKDFISDGSSTDCLERLLRKLVDNYTTLSSAKSVPVEAVVDHQAKGTDANFLEGQTRDILESDAALLKRDTWGNEEENGDSLKKELEETLSELADVKEERDRDREKQHSLVCEAEAMGKKILELQELLHQEEQKSTSVREKLNVAVRKGKLLVQQRDSLKQTIEEMNAELVLLKSQIKDRENALTDNEEKMRDLATYPERVEALEAESSLLRNRLAETEHLLQEKGDTLTMMLNALGDIDVGAEIYSDNPIEKLEYTGKVCHDLLAAVASAEQESKKSGRAAELLLAELNEVQDRNDSLQEELAKASIEISEISRERDTAEAAKLEALSRLERLFTDHAQEKRKQYSELAALKSAANKLRKSFSDINYLLGGVFTMELEFLQNVEAGMASCVKRTEINLAVHVPPFSAADGITFNISENMDNLSVEFPSQSSMPDDFDDNFIIEVCDTVQELMTEIDAVKVTLGKHSGALHDQARNLSKLIGILHREMISQKESFEALERENKDIKTAEKEKEKEIVVLHRNISLLYEACNDTFMEIENRKAEVSGNALATGDIAMNWKPARFADGGGHNFPSEEHFKTMAERLFMAVKEFVSIKGDITEGEKKEMKVMISNLQKELQEKDIQRERICMELVSQIKEAESAVTSYSLDLQSSRTRIYDLEKQVDVMEEERELLDQRLKELQDGQAISADLQERVRSLTDVLAAKEQEIETLMQALDEEEVQMEDLTSKTKELEKILQQKNVDIENLEASRGKALKKLSITVNKFDELHHFSESLLAEVEKLQSQLQERDTEISFLRQEVTRCTNEVLVASQMSCKRNSDDIHELLMWLDTLVSQVGMQDVNLYDSSTAPEHKELLQKKISSIVSKLEDLQVVAQSRDTLVQIERNKVDELTRQIETLESSLHEKESQLNMLEGVEDLGHTTNSVSEIVEVEPVINKWVAPAPSSSSQVRNLRKVNNDQVAIAIDEDPISKNRLEDEDDDKVHGFKSLTTSRIVPKFTRPVSDMIDGLWVSCDRALMRRPALRLCIIIYWAILHALLATFAV